VPKLEGLTPSKTLLLLVYSAFYLNPSGPEASAPDADEASTVHEARLERKHDGLNHCCRFKIEDCHQYQYQYGSALPSLLG